MSEAIIDALRDKGWQQADLAEVIGRSPQYVSDIILGRRVCGRDIAARLGAALWNGESVGLFLAGFVPDGLLARDPEEAVLCLEAVVAARQRFVASLRARAEVETTT